MKGFSNDRWDVTRDDCPFPDGSQDIGQSYEFLSPGSGSEAGTALDFWYAGNGSPVNRNRFDASSYPNSSSARGAASHVSVDSFSVRGPAMTFWVRVGSGAARPVSGFPRRLGESLGRTSLAATGRGFLLSTAGDSLAQLGPVPAPPSGTVAGKASGWTIDGRPLLPGGRSDGLLARTAATPAGPLRFGDGPTAQDLNGDGTPELLLPQAAGIADFRSGRHPCWTFRGERVLFRQWGPLHWLK